MFFLPKTFLLRSSCTHTDELVIIVQSDWLQYVDQLEIYYK